MKQRRPPLTPSCIRTPSKSQAFVEGLSGSPEARGYIESPQAPARGRRHSWTGRRCSSLSASTGRGAVKHLERKASEARSWSPAYRIRPQLGSPERADVAVVLGQATVASTHGGILWPSQRSGGQRTTSAASPLSQGPLVQTPSTGTSASSRSSLATSIATPDSKRSGGDAWSADSEMELALEVVNHLPPDVADRLIDRLRATEAARCCAEERCAALTAVLEAASVAQSGTSTPGRGSAAEEELAGAEVLTPRRSRCWSWRFLFMGLALAATLAMSCIPRPQAGAIGTWPAEGQPAASSVTASPGAELRNGGAQLPEASSVEPSDAVAKSVGEASAEHEDVTCPAALLEVQEDVTNLKLTRWELEERYNKVLEEMSSWVAFLRNSPGFFGEKPSEKKATYEEARQLEDACIQAARPGWNALRQLAPMRKDWEQKDDRRAMEEELLGDCSQVHPNTCSRSSEFLFEVLLAQCIA